MSASSRSPWSAWGRRTSVALSDIIARRYASALYAVADESRTMDRQRSALERASSLLGDRRTVAVLENPRFDPADRQRFALSVLEDATPEVRNLVLLLLERGRVAVLPKVLEEYDRITDAASGRVRAEVVTAIPVDSGLEKTITTTLSERLGGEVQTTVRHDPAILGGLVIRIGDRVIDGSVRTRLEQLQSSLV